MTKQQQKPTTIHEQAVSAWEIKLSVYGARRARHPRNRRAFLLECARHGLARAPEISTWHLARDYRGWERDGRRLGPGSGRSAHWLDISFEHYSVLARAVHREMGYSGRVVSTIVKVLEGTQGGWESREAENARLMTLPPCLVEPTYWHKGYDEEFERRMAYGQGTPEHAARWRLWLRWHGGRAIGEYDAQKILRRIAAEPEYRVSGYLADSVASWREGRQGYECCSGGEAWAWFKSRPEYWDLLASRAPVGARGDGWEQVYPHERERAAELRARGWYHTMRLSDSIWTEKHPLAAA